MLKVVRAARWSPYVVGALIGVLSWVTFAWMEKALGTSTSMVQVAGAIERAVIPAHADANAYLAKTIGTRAEPKAIIEWQLALVLMLPIGALVASRLAGSKFHESVPELWRWRFGPSVAVRWVGAFVGGAVLLFGARLAGGCTSGHGISGGLQLALSSWVFVIAMFVAGVATAYGLFGRKGASHV